MGCGDWQMWPAHMFDCIDKYVGFDVVESVIERNRAAFGSSRVEFHLADATQTSLPQADMLLCKDVLQHLPNVAVHEFLAKAVEKYPIVVVCDDIWRESKSSVRWRRLARGMLNLLTTYPNQRVNEDILLGEYRPIDYALVPFSDLPLVRQLTYQVFVSPSRKVQKVIWSAGGSSAAQR